MRRGRSGPRRLLYRSAPLTANLTLLDLLGSALAFGLYFFILVVPGYVAGWALHLFDFRARLPATRFVIAIVVSVAISPILTFLAYHFASAKLTFAMLAAFIVAFIIILIRSKRPPTPPPVKRLIRRALFAAAAWIVISTLLLVDLQFGDRLYVNRVAYDLTTRVAIINSITRSGVPPVNASYYPGHPVLMTYVYYFWYIPGSLVDQVGGIWVDAHAAMIASAVWCGLGLMSAVALYLRLRNCQQGQDAWNTAFLGSSFLLVSGLDVLAALMQFNTLIPVNGDLEQWNEQIIAWVGALFWIPNHVAALIACMAAVLLVQCMRGQSLRRQSAAALIAGLALASAVGLSVFVTIVFVLFWALWWVVLFFQRETRLSLLMIGIGIIALVAASPFLIPLLHGGRDTTSGGLPLTFAVRNFRPIIPFVEFYAPRLRDLVYLLALPVNYLMELGFYFVAALLWVFQRAKRQSRRDPFHVAEVILLGVTIVSASFFRSTVIDSNDFGWRAWLPGQFVVLVWGVDIIRQYFPSGLRKTSFETRLVRRLRWELKALLFLGLLTTVVDVALLRFWPILVDTGVTASFLRECPDLQQGRRMLAARQAYTYINTHTSDSAIVESNPADILNIPLGLYVNRQIAVSAHTAYGIPRDTYQDRATAVAAIFRDQKTWSDIDASCRQYSIDLLVTNDQDSLWGNLTTLAAQRKPLYRNPYYAVFQCGHSLHP